jgi:hypothetical protein
MKLFVANMSNKRNDFIFRVPGSTRVHHQMIESGAQVQIYKEDLSAVLQGIVQQHERYGLKPASEVLQRKGYTGLCYSFDAPVPVDSFMVAQEKNDTALHEQGVERRQMDAAAIHDRLDTPEAGSLASVELEVVEVPKTLGGDVGVNETIAVSNDPSRTAPQNQGRRGRR